jgi:hypothetical protein
MKIFKFRNDIFTKFITLNCKYKTIDQNILQRTESQNVSKIKRIRS